MKSKGRILLIITVTVLALVVLSMTACEKSNVTSLKANYESLVLAQGESVDISKCVTKEGDGKISYSIENSDILSLKGSVVTAKKEGNASVIVSGGGITVKIQIIVDNSRKNITLTFNDKEVDYNGEKQFVYPEGYVPTGTEINYYCNDKKFEGAVSAGKYEIKAEIKLPAGYNLICDKKTCTLTINKAKQSSVGMAFPDRKFDYDGKEKSVALNFYNDANLPDGITVTYENEKATEVGTYTAKAVFSGSNPNYETFVPMTCTFTINPYCFYIGEYGFKDIVTTYNGEKQFLKIGSLPQGASVSYYVGSENDLTEIDEPAFTDSGDYKVYAKLRIDEKTYRNYIFTGKDSQIFFTKEGNEYESQLCIANMKINKAVPETGKFVLKDSDGNIVQNAVYGNKITIGSVADEGYSLVVEGGNVAGFGNEFIDSVATTYSTLKVNEYGFTDAGTYRVRASYGVTEEYLRNYSAPKAVEYSLKIVKASYDLSSVNFNEEKNEVVFDGTVYDFKVKGADLSDDSDYAVTYSVSCDGKATDEIMHAGEYEIRAKFTLKRDAENYNPLTDKIFKFTIKRKTISIGDVKFPNAETVYDGAGHEPSLVGVLPEGVEVVYLYEGDDPATTIDDIYNPAFVRAGVYPVKAFLKYDKGNANDYVIQTEDGEQISYLYSVFTVRKATITEMPEFELEDNLKYTPKMKLKDVRIKNNDEKYFSWEDEDEEISLSPVKSTVNSATDYTMGQCVAVLHYNFDKDNYEDKTQEVTVIMERYEIDASLISLSDQFVAKDNSVFVKYPEEYKDSADEIFRTVLDYSSSDFSAKLTLKIKSYNYYSIKATVQPDGSVLYENEDCEYVFRLYYYDPAVYEYIAGTCVLKSYKGNAVDITVPKGTRSVKQNAFSGKTINSIYINDGTELSDGAFDGVLSLQELNIPSVIQFGTLKNLFDAGALSKFPTKITVRNDTVIPSWAYQNMTALKYAEYLNAVSEVKPNAFNGCSALESFITANVKGIVSIGQNAFSGCVKLKEVYLPDLSDKTLAFYFSSYTGCTLEKITVGGTKIAENAFKNATALKTIVLPEGLTFIGAQAFSGCGANLDFSEVIGLESVGDNVFEGYAGTSLSLPVSVKKLGVRAFLNATALKSLSLPDGITEIGAECFYGCNNLQIVNMPTELVSVGNGAFCNTSSLKELLFGNKVAYVGDSAFLNCSADIAFETGENAISFGKTVFSEYKGTSVILPSNITVLSEKMFYKAINMTDVALPSELTTIKESCFEGCTALKRINISAKVKTIENYAFYNCNSLSSVVFAGDPPARPSDGDSIFKRNGSVFTVYVPKGKIDVFTIYMDMSGAENNYLIKENLN